MSEIEWIEPDTGLGKYIKLNPTGRWKVKQSWNGHSFLLIEHQGRFFKKWVYDRAIVLRQPDYGTVYQCGKGSK